MQNEEVVESCLREEPSEPTADRARRGSQNLDVELANLVASQNACELICIDPRSAQPSEAAVVVLIHGDQECAASGLVSHRLCGERPTPR